MEDQWRESGGDVATETGTGTETEAEASVGPGARTEARADARTEARAVAGVDAGTEVVRLGPHTVQLRPENGGKYPYGNPLVVQGAERTAMLDACLHAAPVDVDLLLISHYHEDHTVDAGRCAGEVWAHERDVEAVRSEAAFANAMAVPDAQMGVMREEFRWSPVPDAQAFADGHVFDLGGGVRITALHLPGHTPGHTGFFIEPDGVVFLGDVDLSSFGPLYSDAQSRISDFRATLDRCAQIEASVYAAAHHKGPYWDRDEYLAALEVYAKVVETREQKVLGLVRAGRRTAEEMVGQGVVYRPGKRPAFADQVEVSTCGKHLDDLVERGVLVKDAGGAHTIA